MVWLEEASGIRMKSSWQYILESNQEAILAMPLLLLFSKHFAEMRGLQFQIHSNALLEFESCKVIPFNSLRRN